jgi:hypothetical protein
MRLENGKHYITRDKSTIFQVTAISSDSHDFASVIGYEGVPLLLFRATGRISQWGEDALDLVAEVSYVELPDIPTPLFSIDNDQFDLFTYNWDQHKNAPSATQ